MAVDFETLIAQARQLSRDDRLCLIARLSAELHEESQTHQAPPHTLEELRRMTSPWKGLEQPLQESEDREVTDFMEWRREQRAQDRELEEERLQRLHAIWES